MSAPVTEAHRELARRIMFEFTQAGTATASDVRMAAHIIADSEARACELALAKSFTEHPVIMTLKEHDDARAERDQLRAELAPLRELVGVDSRAASGLADIAHWKKLMDAWDENVRLSAEVERLKAQAAFDSDHIHTLNAAFATRAEVAEAIARAERAEAELANIRVLADRRNKSDHSQDTTHQLVVALDQALDIAQDELAAERLARVQLGAERGKVKRLATALKDAISTYNPHRKETLVTAERQEAWIAALKEETK